MTVRALEEDDLDWVVSTLAQRRASLLQHAPVFWRQAPQADAHVPGQRWVNADGPALWDAFTQQVRGADVRFICPTYERHRVEFVRGIGLELTQIWWLRELDGSGGGEAGVAVHLPGAAALTAAPGLGCAAIVVNQAVGDTALARELSMAGFRQHCHYFTGRV